MKKRIYSVLLILTMILSACLGAGNTQQNNTEIEQTDTDLRSEVSIDEGNTEELLEEYLEKLDILETPIREYGESTAYIQLEEDLGVRIAYPETDIVTLNEAMETWIEDIVAYYNKEAVGSSADGDAAELTADYDSYLLGDIVSIKITGIFDKPYLAHPIDIIGTFHANRMTGELVELDDILIGDGRTVLQSKVMQDAGVSQEDVDEHLLDLWTVTSEGLEIVLERGDYLPMSEGTVTLLYPYEELKEILILNENGEIEEITEIVTETEIVESTENVEQAGAIDPDKPMVALTFDDGPSKYTERLLDVFTTHGGKGTFFVVGNLIDSRADIVKRMATEGHEVAGHSWSHRQLTKISTTEVKDQIMTTRAKIYEVTGIDSCVIRPPYGAYNNEVKSTCENLGVVMVNWSVDTLDWKHKDADRVYDSNMKDVKDGDIILCHDLHKTTVDAMEQVIPDLIAQGYQLVTVSELLSYSEKEVLAGKVFNKQ